MAKSGWQQLVAGWPWFEGEGSYPLPAYSEFMPPPRLGRKPYGQDDHALFSEADPYGWRINEYEEAFELRPGLDKVAQQLVHCLANLGCGRPGHEIARAKLQGNPYWPPELAEHVGKFAHERYLVLLPLALTRTQDDKGRTRWTLFGSSEQGPARAFWKSFYTTPRRQVSDEQALAFLRRLLHEVYDVPEKKLTDLRAAGFRVLGGEEPALPYWKVEPLPDWTAPFLWTPRQPVRSVKYLLTFRPFGQLPEAIRKAYLAGELHLLPFPGSMVFWGAQPLLTLQRQLPFAMQIPLLHRIERHEDWRGLRVPQSGWLRHPRPGQDNHDTHHGPIRNTYKRTSRMAKVLKHDDELALITQEAPLTHVLFSPLPDDVALYNKPMARNSQIWTKDYELLLDGPRASRDDLMKALHVVEEGHQLGYRFLYPAMCVGRHEVYWQRPLVAYLSPQTGQPQVVADAPLGYLTAYRADNPDLGRPLELWPRLLQREPHLAALQLFEHAPQTHPYQTMFNVRKLLETRELFGDHPLPRLLARRLLHIDKDQSLEVWLARLPERASDPERGRGLVEELNACLEPPVSESQEGPLLPEALTYGRTAQRSFEVNYWKTIALLAEGRYFTKNNADCCRDEHTEKLLPYQQPQRDLDPLGDYLLAYYQKAVQSAGMMDRVLVGDLPFQWQTDFHYSWMGGWAENQEGRRHERDLIVVIPGRDRRRAVVMGDHYDTAYMLDKYDPHFGGCGARIPACGADDNHSATAALMLGAPVFLELSRAGKLACDIWLIHLTGEEFPADCMGARHLTRCLVEGTLKMRLADGSFHDLSQTRVQGVYVLDMIAHNKDRDHDIFQISPGKGPASMWLAYQAHLANEIWNASTHAWNEQPARRGRGRGKRSPRANIIPEVARHPTLAGEVRPPYSGWSSLYNTDGQIFSDAGVPVVLFMENYDINRSGYHDTHDTMENIDLDYGAAVAAITIESVARAATEEPPAF